MNNLPRIVEGLNEMDEYSVRDELLERESVNEKIDRTGKIALENIRPFTRLIWKSNEIRDEWEPKLNRAASVYHQTEWEMTARGKRKCGTIHVDRDNFNEMFKRFTENDLFFYPIAKSAKYGGFAHKHIQPKEGEPYYVYGAFGRDPKDVMAFKEYERETGDHESIGDLLGYPRCCQKKFTERWPESIDPIFESGEEVEEAENGVIEIKTIPPEANQMLRYFGIRITSHLPCSMKCEKTIELGDEWFSVMKDVDKKGAEFNRRLLEQPIEWNAFRGILEVKTPLFMGITTTGFTEKKKIIRIGNQDEVMS